MKHFRSISLAVAFIFSLGAYAYDFSVMLDGQLICFDITNKSKKTACVTYNGRENKGKESYLKGSVKIPAKVKHNNVIYDITAIGQKAFADEKYLEGIVIPSGIETIGDFAFEGCVSLKKIVFPGNAVKLGQGIFFKCSAITSVTIGSDWENIDLTMFRWSNDLKEISIPAKIEKIQGLKKLKRLEAIIVDPNNTRFSSHAGILYNKNGKTMYGCPRGYGSRITIPEGTEIIEPGALIDCTSATQINFPSSLKSISFRETSRMKGLTTIVMKPLNPVITAFSGEEGKFMFQLCNPKTEIIVPSKSKAKYINLLPTSSGQYSDTRGGLPYEVTENELPTKKNIKGVSNFDKY